MTASELENPLVSGPFQFLKDLKVHNDRERFAANRARYESEARNPVLRLIVAFSEPLAATAFTDAEILAPDFPTRLAEALTDAAPLVHFLCKALELPF